MDYFENYYEFGDYILFQEYQSIWNNDTKKYDVKIHKPILAIYLNDDIYDQALAFRFIKWINNNRICNKPYDPYTNFPEVGEVILWGSNVEVLGFWKHKPSWKEILKAYRLLNTNDYKE